jgi:putative transposase
MSIYLQESQCIGILYHIVCPAKYRRDIFRDEVDEALKEVCIEIGKRYEIHFVEIRTDKDHVHFFVQSVPMYSPTKIVKMIKSITAREIFRRVPSAGKELWGGEFWTDGYYVNTVSKYGNEDVIRKYVEGQGCKGQYKKLHNEQLKLF